MQQAYSQAGKSLNIFLSIPPPPHTHTHTPSSPPSHDCPAHDGFAGGLVVVEEVSPQQHQVGIVVRRYLEHLLKGDEGVVLADLILLPDTLRLG
jgi:hypothetical protein